MEAVHQPAAPGEASDATTKLDEVDASALDAAHAQPAAPTTTSDVEMTAVTPVKGAVDGPAVQEKRMLEVDGPADFNGEAASSTSQPPKKKPRKSNGPKPVTQYCHQGARGTFGSPCALGNFRELTPCLSPDTQTTSRTMSAR